MTAITLTLPYPISANTYWRHTARHGFAQTIVSKEAKAYKADVARICRLAGIDSPLAGRVSIDIQLFPALPKDWQARKRKEGDDWDDSVRCIDLDNANKVLLDALKGIAIEDDKWVRRMTAERMTPDGTGARVVVTISAMRESVRLPMTPGDLFAGLAVQRAIGEPF